MSVSYKMVAKAKFIVLFALISHCQEDTTVTPGSDASVSDSLATDSPPKTFGVRVTPLEGLMTTAQGGTASFSIELVSQPTASVSIALSLSKTDVATLSTAKVVFTPENWSQRQTVTVTGATTQVATGNISYEVLTAPCESTDTSYAGLDPVDVSVMQKNPLVPALSVTPSSAAITLSNTAKISVKLASEPTSDVALRATSSDTTRMTVGSSSLVFTKQNWSTVQEIVLSAVPDNVARASSIVSLSLQLENTTDTSGYAKLAAFNVPVSVANKNEKKVIVASSGSLTTASGGKISLSYALASQPTGTVTLQFSSSAPATADVSLSTLTFTPENYATPQTIDVVGKDDEKGVALTPYQVNVKVNGADYDGLSVAPVQLVNSSPYVPSVKVTPLGGLQVGLLTSSSFSVSLGAKPTGNVSFSFSSPPQANANLSSTKVVFTPQNWSTTQTVTVSMDPSEPMQPPYSFFVTMASADTADARYVGMGANSIGVQRRDWMLSRVTVTPTGAEASGGDSLSLSRNGRIVAFRSDSTALVSGDTNGASDIFVRDLDKNATERVSVSSLGVEAATSSASRRPMISATGRFVVFSSTAANLVAQDSNNVEDVFLRDRQTNVTERVSLPGSNAPDVGGTRPVVSEDGRYVAFEAPPTLTSDSDKFTNKNVYLRDRTSGTTTLVSKFSLVKSALPSSFSFANTSLERIVWMTPDARYIVFAAQTLAFRFDRQNNSVTLLTKDASAQPLGGGFTGPLFDNTQRVLSNDGNYFVFSSSNTAAISPPLAGQQIYMRNLTKGTNQHVSKSPISLLASNSTYNPVMSEDARFIVAWSNDNTLVPRIYNNFDQDSSQAYVFDTKLAHVVRVSVNENGLPADLGGLRNPDSGTTISGDGLSVAFPAWGVTLMPGVSMGDPNIFVGRRL